MSTKKEAKKKVAVVVEPAPPGDSFEHMKDALGVALVAVRKARSESRHREMGMAIDALGDALEEARRWAGTAAKVNQAEKLGVVLE